MIYLGKIANTILNKNLENRNYNKCSGYFLDGKIWVAFDNTSGNCWVEEFNSEEMAICWLEHFYEVSDSNEFNVLKIKQDLLFIPNNGFLKIEYKINAINSKLHSFFA